MMEMNSISVAEKRPLNLPSAAEPIPATWRWERLDDVCIGICDCPHSTPVLTADGPLVVRSQDMRSGVFRVEQAGRVSEETYAERIRRAEPKRGDILYSREGTYFGIAAEVPAETRVCLGQRMVLLRPDEKQIDFRYLRFWLNSPVLATHVYGQRDGTVAERLNMPTIRALPIPLAPLAEQRGIARVLGALDDKIELNRRMNRTLEELAGALFRAWFVDFEPVVAKAAGRAPFGLAPAALFPATFTDSELGPIPHGWRVRPAPELIEFNPTRRLAKNAPAPYLDMQNVPTNSALPAEWIVRPFGSGMKFQNGDTLLARITPCLENGKTGYVNALADDEVGWGSTEFIVMHPRDPLPPEFGYFLARSDEFRAHAIANMTGSSGRQRVPVNCFETFLLAEPSKPLAREFGKVAAVAMRKMKANVEESRTLAALRDTLLPKLLSGELRVKNVEATIGKIPAAL